MEDDELTKWEYKWQDVASGYGPTTEKEVNQLGEQGWELAGITTGGTGVFKRKKRPQTQTRDDDWMYGR